MAWSRPLALLWECATWRLSQLRLLLSSAGNIQHYTNNKSYIIR